MISKSDKIFSIEFRRGEPGLIYPPLLKIDYDTVKIDSMTKISEVQLEFEMRYSMDSSRYDKDIEITMGTLCSIGAVWAGIRTWSWTRRSGRMAVDFLVFQIFYSNFISNLFKSFI